MSSSDPTSSVPIHRIVTWKTPVTPRGAVNFQNSDQQGAGRGGRDPLARRVLDLRDQPDEPHQRDRERHGNRDPPPQGDAEGAAAGEDDRADAHELEERPPDPVDERVGKHRPETAGRRDRDGVGRRHRQERRQHPDVRRHPIRVGVLVVREDRRQRIGQEERELGEDDPRHEPGQDPDRHAAADVRDPAEHAQARDHPGEARVGAQLAGVREDDEEGDRHEERAGLALGERLGHDDDERELEEAVHDRRRRS